MCDVAGSVLQHLQPRQYVVVGYAGAAVCEHHVVADGVGHAGANGAPFAEVGVQAKHATGDADGRGDFFGFGGGAVLAAVVNDDDLAGHIVFLEKGGRLADVAGDLLALFKSRYDDG